MGPVGQIVKILFYVFLSAELILAVTIYAMATLLLCSRTTLPEHILSHTVVALFLAIFTLSIIHKGFQAVSHDCTFHLYWFAAIFLVLLLFQFLFEMFGLRESSRQGWQSHSLSANIRNKRLIEESFREEAEFGSDDVVEKMAYRIPSPEEAEAHKRKMYGLDHRTIEASENVDSETKKVKLKKEKYRPPKYIRRKSKGGVSSRSDEEDSLEIVGNVTRPEPVDEIEEEEVERGTPLVLTFHGYSFILKMVCIALAILTGFLYQVEYV